MNKSKLQSEIKALDKALETKLLDLQFSKHPDLCDRLNAMSADPLAYFESEITARYDDMLNDLYSDVFEALPFNIGSPAEAMQEFDNCQYRCGLNDFADQFDVSEFGEYQDQLEEIQELEEEIRDLESELEDLKEELEKLENI